MATLPVDETNIIRQFGPHLSCMAGDRLSTTAEPERLVRTHCCFCGQQCGIQPKVKDNVVIGFEPWEEFPFNRGMLCPKGVKRYLQGAHPDRLLTAIRRDPSSPAGFSPMPYDEAINRVATHLQPELHAPVVCGGAARGAKRDPLPLPRWALRPANRPLDRQPSAAAADAHRRRGAPGRRVRDGHRAEDGITAPGQHGSYGGGSAPTRRSIDPAANPGAAPAVTPYAGRFSRTRLYPRPMTRDQRTTVVYGILCFILILVVLQLWLLIATMNAYLGGDESVILPAGITSGLCLLLNLGLLRYLYAIERQ